MLPFLLWAGLALTPSAEPGPDSALELGQSVLEGASASVIPGGFTRRHVKHEGHQASTSAPRTRGPLDGFWFDLETGPLLIARNDAQYGPADGTFFTAGDLVQNRNLLSSLRLVAEARFWDTESLIFLYAPLDLTTRVALPKEIIFQDTTFARGTVVDARYKFEGWRLSWLHRVAGTWEDGFEVGLTNQIRNAIVSLSDVQGLKYDDEQDIGWVPAVKVRWRKPLPQGMSFVWEADASSTLGLLPVEGGLLDTAATLFIPLQRRLDTFFRARWVNGGATVPDRRIFNDSDFFAALVGLRWQVR
ncbi:MAG: hypothetical protein VKO21_07230 [Candidatus Sericytochromatia bacterium]|nr:hypothetical protein [Candidatus Sericytochromatia bacterium]